MKRPLAVPALIACIVATFAVAAVAQDEIKQTTVLDNLNNPCAVAIQPETGHLFVSEAGAGRVVRVVDGKLEPVITDFPKDVYGKGPKYDIGPLGLVFLDKSTLVVGGGGLPDGEELLRVYTIPEAGAEPIKADAMKASYTLAATDDIKGEGNFYGLAATKDAVYVTCNGDDTKGWVSKATIADGSLSGFERYIPTKEKTDLDAPVAATISPHGDLVIGQMGEITVPGDGMLTFYNPASGEMLLNLPTTLSDVTALAYAPMPKPKKRQLYALDYSWAEPEKGGLYQLLKKIVDGKQTIGTREIVLLDKPTAMVFAESGELYVTIIGTAEEGAEGSPGKLIKLEGKF